MNRLATTLFCFTLLMAAPAQAQQREYKAGLNYTTLGAKPKPAQTEDIQAQPAKQAKETQTSDAGKEPEDSATRIWNKYKELATGTAGEKETAHTDAKPEAPEKPDKPVKPAAGTTAPSPSEAQSKNAFQSIIEGWKQNKENRRDMRSMSFNTPDLPAKPLSQKPEAP